MARSRRKTPIHGRTWAPSEKQDKRAAHRLERRKVHLLLSADQEVEVLPALKELSRPQDMAKDGKIYLGTGTDLSLMRELFYLGIATDPTLMRRLMRK
jgi:hypothetical protein